MVGRNFRYALPVTVSDKQIVGKGHVTADKDEAEVFRLLSGAAAEEMGSGNRDSICVVGFIEERERCGGGKRSAQQVGFRNDTARGIERFVRTNGYGRIEKSVCQKKRLRFSVSSGRPKRGTTSRLTGASSLLPPVYSEAWAKAGVHYLLLSVWTLVPVRLGKQFSGNSTVWTRSLPRQLTVALHTQWRVVLKGGTGGSGCKTVAAFADMGGSSSSRVDEDDVEIAGVDINIFGLGRDESDCNKFNALTLRQCLFGKTEERYHQPIDRSRLAPATRLQRSVGQRTSMVVHNTAVQHPLSTVSPESNPTIVVLQTDA
ncbi:hypothetical protein TNCV_3668201 [Trichonephila clavipes]|nr:hypothetical protein TNCV_3668201 [Trichonephila clavipes]